MRTHLYMHIKVAVQTGISLSFALIQHALADGSLTDEPRIPPIVLDGQVEEILFETLNGVRLGLDR